MTLPHDCYVYAAHCPSWPTVQAGLRGASLAPHPHQDSDPDSDAVNQMCLAMALALAPSLPIIPTLLCDKTPRVDRACEADVTEHPVVAWSGSHGSAAALALNLTSS